MMATGKLKYILIPFLLGVIFLLSGCSVGGNSGDEESINTDAPDVLTLHDVKVNSSRCEIEPGSALDFILYIKKENHTVVFPHIIPETYASDHLYPCFTGSKLG